MPADTPLAEILPALEELDDQLLGQQQSEFSTTLIETTANQVATNYGIDSDQLLNQFATVIAMTTPEESDDPEFYARLETYLQSRNADTAEK